VCLASCRQGQAVASTDGSAASAPLHKCEVGAPLSGMHAHFLCRYMVIVCSTIGLRGCARLWPRPLWVVWRRRHGAVSVGPPRALRRVALPHPGWRRRLASARISHIIEQCTHWRGAMHGVASRGKGCGRLCRGTGGAAGVPHCPRNRDNPAVGAGTPTR
jgi:hypothetical protein